MGGAERIPSWRGARAAASLREQVTAASCRWALEGGIRGGDPREEQAGLGEFCCAARAAGPVSWRRDCRRVPRPGRARPLDPQLGLESRPGQPPGNTAAGEWPFVRPRERPRVALPRTRTLGGFTVATEYQPKAEVFISLGFKSLGAGGGREVVGLMVVIPL